MQEIVESVRQVSGLIAEIAAASQEQSSGIEQVNTAITQMDHVVQQNAALVDQAATSTESMHAQAQGLLRMVERFNLGGAAGLVHAREMPQVQSQPATPADPAPMPIRFKPAARLPAGGGARLHGATSHQPEGDWRQF